MRPENAKRNCPHRSREHHQSSHRIQKRNHLHAPCELRARGRAQRIRHTCNAPHLRPPRRCVVPQTEPRSVPERMPLHPVSQRRDGIERMSVEAPHRPRRQKVMPAKAVMRFCCLPPAGKVFGGSQGSEIHESLCSPPKLDSERAESRVSERLAFLRWLVARWSPAYSHIAPQSNQCRRHDHRSVRCGADSPFTVAVSLVDVPVSSATLVVTGNSPMNPSRIVFVLRF